MFFAALITSAALASGGASTTPPKPTQTTKDCIDGQIWDEKTKTCVNPQSGALDDDTLYGAVREFAYAGQYENAQTALWAMSDQHEARVLTYWGFTSRKMGKTELGMAYYADALEQDPDNFLARSYMGQALFDLLLPGSLISYVLDISSPFAPYDAAMCHFKGCQ